MAIDMMPVRPVQLLTTTRFRGTNSMIELFPRHYRIDERGRHVLIGLSAEETLEFEKLEELPPLDDSGRIASLSLDP